MILRVDPADRIERPEERHHKLAACGRSSSEMTVELAGVGVRSPREVGAGGSPWDTGHRTAHAMARPLLTSAALLASLFAGCRSRLPLPLPEPGEPGPVRVHGGRPWWMSFRERTPAFVRDTPLPQTLRALREHWPTTVPAVLGLLPAWLDQASVEVYALHVEEDTPGRVKLAVYLLAAREAGRVAWLGVVHADGTLEEAQSYGRGIFLLEDAKGPR